MPGSDFVAGAGSVNIDLLYYGIDSLPVEGEEVYSKNFSLQLGGGKMCIRDSIKIEHTVKHHASAEDAAAFGFYDYWSDFCGRVQGEIVESACMVALHYFFGDFGITEHCPDVYKRQVKSDASNGTSNAKAMLKRSCPELSDAHCEDIVAVSYTHL